MLNSLFDNKTAKKFDTIAKKKARVHDEEVAAAKEFMRNISRETVYNVLDTTDRSGHPDEQSLSLALRNKYDSGQGLEFDDIMTLDALYKSNYKQCNNKDGYDE